MHVRVVTPPAPILSWADLKRHLLVDSDDEQVYGEGLIAAATAWIDGPDGWLGRALGPQLLEWRPDTWPSDDHFRLPIDPLLEVDSIKYVDPSGAEQDYAFPTPLYFENTPAWRGRAGDLRIRYWAGYGRCDADDPDKWVAEVPAPIKQAVLLLVGQWFHTRSTVRIGDSVAAMPFVTEALLSPYRSWRP